MTPQEFRLVEEIFHGALERSGDARLAYLDERCSTNPHLRPMVERLLHQHETTGSFLVPPDGSSIGGTAGGTESKRRAGRSPSLAGRRIGRYEVVRLIATGGMGSVYEATQERPERRVALKILRTGLGSESAERRFEFESQVLASLRHPCIAQVYEAGIHEDLGGPVPYFAMELVSGPPITEYCATVSLGRMERLALFVRVCDALQHAHQRGVVHRDVKPSNILVDTSTPGQATPKVIDFGVARPVSAGSAAGSMGTEAGRVIGTLAYMSPEQCSGRTGEIDTRADIYSLGALLYELVCGRPAFDLTGKSIAEAAATVAGRAPARPSSIEPAARGDLETIILKSMEHDADRRYQSAAELGRDVERYLALQPITARPATALYHARMFARRHRALVTMSIAAICVLVAATVVSVRFALVAREQTRVANESVSKAHRRADFLQGVLAAANPWFPPAFISEDLSDYEPWDEWQHSPWPYAGMPGRSASVADLLMAAGERVEAEFADDPLTRARLSDTLGWTLQRLLSTEERHPGQAAMLKLAERLLRDAVAIRREVLGEEDEQTIRSTLRLAEFLDYTPGGAEEGGALYDRAWRICVHAYGERDARTLHALRSWANNEAFLNGRRTSALERLRGAVGWAAEPGATGATPAVYITLAYLAYVEVLSGSCERGASLGRLAVSKLESQAGAGNIRTAFAQQYVGLALMQCSQTSEAIALLKQVIVTQSKFFGTESLELARRWGELCDAQAAGGAWSDAAVSAQQSMRLVEGIRGEGHSDTQAAKWRLAECLWYARERLDESEKLAMEAYRARVASTSATDWVSVYYAKRMIQAGLTDGKFERTLAFVEEQLGYVSSGSAEPDWEVDLHRLHALCLGGIKRYAEAEATLVAGIEAGKRRKASPASVAALEELLATGRKKLGNG